MTSTCRSQSVSSFCYSVLLLLLLALAVRCSSAQAPSWNTVQLDPLVFPYGGAELLNSTKWTRLYFATPEVGQYAMSPMISYLNSAFLATWKVAPKNEDQPGQLIRFAQSVDGETWINISTSGVALDAPGILFPSMNSTENPGVALFAEPSLYLNKHVYAAASPRQFCLYPDQYQGILLLRRVFPGIGKFGPIFWASSVIPTGFAEASAKHNITAVVDQDTETQADIALLVPNQVAPPCDPLGTTKCEFCAGGCQNWTVAMSVPHMENERTHYVAPATGDDIILYRTRNPELLVNYLYYSIRTSASGGEWSYPQPTNITNDVANLNAGTLPDGRVYLVSNVMTNIFRDPIYVSLSRNGVEFTAVAALGSCEQPHFTNPWQPLGCVQRYGGGGIQGGLQYPQAVAVTAAEGGVEGFYVILSQNKEDIWVAKTPFSSLQI